MRPTTKDTAGLVLVVGTCAALVIHGGTEHQQTHTVHPLDVAAEAAHRTFALVDVQLLPRSGEDTLEHQVVLVEDGMVTSVGPVGAIAAPANTRVVQGRGLYLVPGRIEALQELYDGQSAMPPAEESFKAGVPADFVLFEGNPRVDPDAIRYPRGAVEGGTWYEQRDLAQMMANPARRAADGGGP